MAVIKANLSGDDQGVAVAKTGNQYMVEFPYDPVLVKMMHQVEGAEFVKEDGLWKVPKASEAALAEAIGAMRVESAAIAADKAAIFVLATSAAETRMNENGAGVDAKPRVSDYLKTNGRYSGEIINANARFAAQLTGFGAEDGAAFVTVHRAANLRDSVLKGDDVSIKYDGKGMAAVSARSRAKTGDEIVQEFNATLGKAVDGVLVADAGDKYLVKFDFNPALESRLRRLNGVSFDKEAEAFVAPKEVDGVDMTRNIRSAVHQMRQTFSNEQVERADLTTLAASKMDGATVKDAFTKEGAFHTGKIVGVGDHFALQHTGQNYFNLHRVGQLDKVPEVDQKVEIKYHHGRGVVKDREAQSQDKGHGR